MSGPGPVIGGELVATSRLGEARGRWVVLAAVLGSGVTGIDATVINIAIPAFGRDLPADFASLQWTITSYTLTLASLILLGGSLGDRYGRRRVFLAGVTWFALASALCALAPNIAVLIGARALQGIGGAGVLLFLRLGRGTSYFTDVLPAVIVFGLGLSLIVAPLTSTVLAAAETRHAGVASGVNNAIARAAGLLAVALIPVLAGISGDDYQHPSAFASGFRIAMIACAALLIVGAPLQTAEPRSGEAA